MREREKNIEVIRTKSGLGDFVRARRQLHKKIGFVPTMGALHAGHLSLVELALQRCDDVIVSIFVNPAQFGPAEDFEAYPRVEAEDIAKLSQTGCSAVYMPSKTEVYPAGFDANVHVGGVSSGLCSASRPHFFDGVATIVTKLLLQVMPDEAVFGEKDFQQLQLVRKLVRDLDIPVNIVGGPVIREEDGLAMSSRNAYLSLDERATAPLLYNSLQALAERIVSGEDINGAVRSTIHQLEKNGFVVDYLEVREEERLFPVTQFSSVSPRPLRIFVAAWLGRTRLIDNIPLPGTTSSL